MKRVIVACLCFGVGAATAQTRARPGGVRPETGKVYLDLDFTTAPTTVEALLQESNLVVDGQVIAILPSIRQNPKNLEMIQTDFLVAVNQVLSGTLPPGGGTIAISQFGGKIGELEAVFPKDAMMEVGERYIFFLRRDTSSSPNAEGYLRYYPAGGWIGKAKVVNGTISFPGNVHGGGLTFYNGSDITGFIAAVAQKIAVSGQQKTANN